MTWKIKEAVFLRAMVTPDQAPETLPAVAFVGRSNVGKSSLINKLLGANKLARTSSTPGCTRQIIYFGIDQRYHFIDLPGYGYAKVSKQEQTRLRGMMRRFFEVAEGIRIVVLLIDARRTPTPEDLLMIEWLGAGGHSYIFAVTKCDKVPRAVRQATLNALQKALGLPDSNALIPVSAHTGEGVEDLMAVIREALEAEAKVVK